MKIEEIKSLTTRMRILAAMAETDELVERMRKEIPSDAETVRKVQDTQPEPAVCHEPLAAVQGAQEGSRRIVVRIASFRARLCDPDNLCAKSLVDGLRYAQLIPDDRPQDIELSVSQTKCEKKDERTEIELIYPG